MFTEPSRDVLAIYTHLHPIVDFLREKETRSQVPLECSSDIKSIIADLYPKWGKAFNKDKNRCCGQEIKDKLLEIR
ncbi:hypothetical protein AXF42_Ash010282 [Apostasia shenzhenica]|uniref:Uncharacterized protein n=1 Tax=Apostasia shenzhenica TaxID=1088818 RepID=A0A2I0BDJ8_9ASPA|nr:hypothetical protein AXF42_Ash010282 [Apostasia shenzhenica]